MSFCSCGNFNLTYILSKVRTHLKTLFNSNCPFIIDFLNNCWLLVFFFFLFHVLNLYLSVEVDIASKEVSGQYLISIILPIFC